MLGLGNLGQNLRKSINGIIPKEEHTCEQKRFFTIMLLTLEIKGSLPV